MTVLLYILFHFGELYCGFDYLHIFCFFILFAIKKFLLIFFTSRLMNSLQGVILPNFDIYFFLLARNQLSKCLFLIHYNFANHVYSSMLKDIFVEATIQGKYAITLSAYCK